LAASGGQVVQQAMFDTHLGKHPPASLVRSLAAAAGIYLYIITIYHVFEVYAWLQGTAFPQLPSAVIGTVGSLYPVIEGDADCHAHPYKLSCTSYEGGVRTLYAPLCSVCRLKLEPSLSPP
jgi:hypothetical protein